MDKNYVVVITGGTKGFGKALADKYRSEGAQVIVLSRTAPDNGETSFSADVGNESDVKSVFNRIGERYGKIDILINNAGHGQSGALELIPASDLKEITDTNLLGMVYCAKYALPYMRKGARIINIGSVSAYLPMPFRTMYAVTKSAVNMFGYGLRIELAPTGILVTTCCLPDMDTDFKKHRTLNTDTNTRYGDRIKAADDFVNGRPSVRNVKTAKVVERVYGISQKSVPRPSYIIGAKYKLLYCVYKLFPIKVLLNIISKIFG